MNHLKARQVEGTGKWHFAISNSRTGTHAVGYCRDHEGHDTEAEAVECYRQYLLAERLRFGSVKNQQHKCQKCDAWTQKFALIDNSQSMFLCDDHATKEVISELYKGASEIWSS